MKKAAAGPGDRGPPRRRGDRPGRLAYLASASLNTHTLPPCSRKFTRLATSPPHSGTAPPQPETTATNCWPSFCQVTGGATTPEPVWNCHTTLPALVITPPHSGALFLTSHTILPLFGSTARRAPM